MASVIVTESSDNIIVVDEVGMQAARLATTLGVRAAARPELAAWYAAIANRETAAAKVVLMSDSIWDGGQITTFDKQNYRLVESRLRKLLGMADGSSGGYGYIPGVQVGWGVAPPVILTGTENAVTGAGWYKLPYGLGVRALGLSSGATASWTQVCDRVKVYYSKRTAYVGPADVYIDDVLVTSLTSIGGTDSAGYVWDSGALTPGSHTLKIVATGAWTGFCFTLDGVEFLNSDTDRGIHVYGGGHYGGSTATYLSSDAYAGHWKTFDLLQPQLTVIALGTNDLIGITTDEYLANLDTIINRIDSSLGATPHSIVLVIPYAVPSNIVGREDRWNGYVNGIYARASAHVSVLDLNMCWPALVTSGATNNGLMFESTDPIHPNDAGSSLLADILIHHIMPSPQITLASGGTRVIDLGTTPSASFMRTISWPGATVGQPIICTPSTDYPSSIRSDEYEMAPFVVAGKVSAADTIEVIVQSVLGAPIAGRVRVNISV